MLVCMTEGEVSGQGPANAKCMTIRERHACRKAYLDVAKEQALEWLHGYGQLNTNASWEDILAAVETWDPQLYYRCVAHSRPGELALHKCHEPAAVRVVMSVWCDQVRSICMPGLMPGSGLCPYLCSCLLQLKDSLSPLHHASCYAAFSRALLA